MRKIDEFKGPSCLTNAKDDEPIFVLKSTDELAPSMVRMWALAYEMTKNKGAGGMTKKQNDKLQEAYDLADMMEDWRAAQGKTDHLSTTGE